MRQLLRCVVLLGWGLSDVVCLPAAHAGDVATSFTLSSPAFSSGAPIPKEHTCDGADRSPPLNWKAVPAGAKGFALIVDDPDAPAGTWVHWVIYNLPADAAQLGLAVPKDDTLANGAQQGLNDFRRVGYAGPCPPPGKPHRYFFKLYALDSSVALKARATKADVLRAIEGHVLAHTELVGTYGR